MVLSGSLLGPETSRDYDGAIDGTPVFLGCSTDDPYVTVERIHESTEVFEQLGGDVTSKLYDGLGHAINDDEIQMINTYIESLV